MINQRRPPICAYIYQSYSPVTPNESFVSGFRFARNSHFLSHIRADLFIYSKVLKHPSHRTRDVRIVRTFFLLLLKCIFCPLSVPRQSSAPRSHFINCATYVFHASWWFVARLCFMRTCRVISTNLLWPGAAQRKVNGMMKKNKHNKKCRLSAVFGPFGRVMPRRGFVIAFFFLPCLRSDFYLATYTDYQGVFFRWPE